jgi:uncharacterized protein (TIGR03083 family)
MPESARPLSDAELLAAFDAAVAALAAVPADQGRSMVPACPDWTVDELFEHVSRVHRWATQILTTKPETRPHRDRSPLADDVDRHSYVAEGAAALRAALVATDLDEVVWTFAGPAPARWWLRRQAQETTLHALDAIEAAGQGDLPVSPELAVDGVSELLDVFVPLVFDVESFAGTGETLHLHATDAPGEWLVTFEPGKVVVTGEHAKGDVAARGPALDLLRLMWGRTAGPGLTLFGNAAIIDRFHASGRF